MTRRTADAGTVSHGTLRAHDLITTYMQLLGQLDPARAAQYSEVARIAVNATDGTYAADPSYSPAEVEYAEDAAMSFLSELEDMLAEYAPTGHWFGAHPGDASDFGYWPNDDTDGAA